MRIPWARVLGEGMVIVVGILIALAADAWWDGHVERREEQAVLRELSSEFADNAVQLDSVLAHHQTGRRAAEVLLTFARGDVALSADSVRALVVVLDNPWTYNPKSGALEALIAAGRLGIISDPALRTELAGWAGLLEDYREDEELARAYALGPQYEYFSSVLDWSVLYGSGADPAPASLLGLANDQRFRSMVAYRGSFLENILTEAQYLVESLEDIRRSLAASMRSEG